MTKEGFFEDPNGLIWSRKSMDTQCKCQNKEDKGTNNDLQNYTQKTEDWETRTTQNK
jgi:hypothetical protein